MASAAALDPLLGAARPRGKHGWREGVDWRPQPCYGGSGEKHEDEENHPPHSLSLTHSLLSLLVNNYSQGNQPLGGAG